MGLGGGSGAGKRGVGDGRSWRSWEEGVLMRGAGGAGRWGWSWVWQGATLCRDRAQA